MSTIIDEAEQLIQAAGGLERRTAGSLARMGTELTEHTPPKFLVGVSAIMHQAAEFSPGAARAAHEFRYAYWRKTLYPESWISRLLLEKKAGELKSALAEAARKAADKKVKAALLKEIENVEIASTALSGAKDIVKPAPVTELGRLEAHLYTDAIRNDEAFDSLRSALARWQDAASGFDADELRASDRELCKRLRVLSTLKSNTTILGPSSVYVKAVQRATQALSEKLPTEEALRMLSPLGDVVGDLLRAQKLAGVPEYTLLWRHIMPSMEASPNAWGRIGQKLASMKPVKASDTKAVKGLVTEARHALSEAIGTASPAYRTAIGKGMRRGEIVAATLNVGTPGWRVIRPHVPLFAPGLKGEAGKLFVDDAILVLNDRLKKAYVIFIGQVKAGDATSLKAVKQMIKDQTRLFLGSLNLNGVEYDMIPPSDLAWVQRVFVGTTRPKGARRLSGQVEHIDAPLDAKALDDLALAWLRRVGKVIN